jgi:hypothetical protein
MTRLGQAIGAPVATRTTPPPRVDAAQEAAFMKKVMELAPKYRTELLKEASRAGSRITGPHKPAFFSAQTYDD